MSKKKKKGPASSFNKILDFPKIILSFTKEARDELKKVTWPTRQVTIRYTIIVVISSITVGMVIGGIDYLFQIGLENII